MQRYTFIENERWNVRDTDGNLNCGEWVDLLAEYENLGYQPNEIKNLISSSKHNAGTCNADKHWREVMNLSTRAVNALRFSKLTENMTVSQLAQLKAWDISCLRNIGELTRRQIAQELERLGFYGTDWSLTDY